MRFQLGLVISLVVLVARVAWGQGVETPLVFHQARGAAFVGLQGTLYRMDLEALAADSFSTLPRADLFAPRTYPREYSASISNNELWLWDAGVGTTVKYDSLGNQSIFLTDPSFSRHNHQGLFSSVLNQPILFGGYGHFRAKDFFLTFDRSSKSWIELAADYIGEQPKPQQNTRLLEDAATGLVYLFGGHTSATTNMPLYNKQDFLAWSYDPANGHYRRLYSMPHPLLRAMSLSSVSAINTPFSDKAVWVSLSPDVSPTSPGNYDVFIWDAATGKYGSFSIPFVQPPKSRILAIRNKNDSLAIITIGVLPKPGEKPRISRQVYAYPERLDWISLKSFEPYYRLGFTVLTLLVVLAAGIHFLKRREKNSGPTIFFRAENLKLEFHVDGKSFVETLSPVNALILDAILRSAENDSAHVGTIIDTLSDKTGYDPDSLRSTLHRSVGQINELCRTYLQHDFISKKRDPRDGRRVILVVGCPVSRSP